MQNNLHFLHKSSNVLLSETGFSAAKCTPLRCLNVSLITHLQYLMLTCSFSLAEPNTSSSLLPAWLSVYLSPSSLPLATLGIVLTSGCATSRHCQQQELPGVRIHCCDSDLCNSASSRHAGALHYISALVSLLMLKMWLWYEEEEVPNTHWTMGEAFSISISHCWHGGPDTADSEWCCWRTPCAHHNSICKYLEKPEKHRKSFCT